MDVSVDQLVAAVQDGSDDPLDRVSAAALLKDQLEHLGDDLLDHFVTRARSDGRSWTQIGEALGVTRQAAQQRHGGLVDRILGGLTDRRFQRFTPKTRTAVVEAQNAARDRKHGTVGTEHLLLGLYAAGDGNLATVALDHLGLDRAAAERLVDARVAPGTAPVKGHIRFGPGAKKTLELSLRHALELGHNYIGTEHIVLALRQIEDGVAAQVMAEAGIGYDDLRTEVLVALRKITGDA
jgi:hypothetical protein